jgi:hypothetical protein
MLRCGEKCGKKMKWIKISDRLPDGQNTLCYTIYGETIMARAYEDLDKNIIFKDDCEFIYNLEVVTHWMELPESPRTKENFKIEKFDYEQYHYSKDVERIVKVAYDNELFLNPYEAYNLWEVYSDEMCAGWLYLPTCDEELLETIKEYNR